MAVFNLPLRQHAFTDCRGVNCVSEPYVPGHPVERPNLPYPDVALVILSTMIERQLKGSGKRKRAKILRLLHECADDMDRLGGVRRLKPADRKADSDMAGIRKSGAALLRAWAELYGRMYVEDEAGG